jgi:signal transduction histidine kinase
MSIRDIQAVEPPPGLGHWPSFAPVHPQPADPRGAVEFHEAKQWLARQEQLAVLGEHAAMIVHEIRSPLSTVAMALESVARENLSERALKRIAIARREEKRLDALVNEILRYAKPQAPSMKSLSVNELLREVIEMVGTGADGSAPAIEYQDTPESVVTCGDRDRLNQAFINLVVNACEAVSPHQTVHVSLDVDEPAGTVRVVIRNDGHIPLQALERLTAPFYTTKPGGTGLGLSIVQRIVHAHGGFLDISSDPDEGVRVTVGLGMSRSADPASPTSRARAAPSSFAASCRCSAGSG